MTTHSRKTILLATDQQQSVLNSLDANGPRAIVYTPYGHRPRENGLLSLIGFNGQLPDALTGHYHLGNGYRQFNPVLMRFNSPDSWSPFGAGGLNAYAYCAGEPVHRNDNTGHMFKLPLTKAGSAIGAASPVSKLSKIPEVVKPPTAVNTASVIADGPALPGLAPKTTTGQIKNPRTLPSTSDIQFREALELAVNAKQPISPANNAVTPPVLVPGPTVRPVRSRNKHVIGGDSDFLNIKIAASKLPEPASLNKEVRTP